MVSCTVGVVVLLLPQGVEDGLLHGIVFRVGFNVVVPQR